MLTIADGEALSRALRSEIDHHIKRLLRLRGEQLSGDLTDVAIAIAEAGDTPADIQRVTGLALFGRLALAPDWVEDHGFAAEVAFDLTQSFTQVLIIPHDEAI